MARLTRMTALIGATLVAAALTAQAGAAPAAKKVIEDPVGDANFVNDQGTGDGSFGDQTAADAGTVSDLISVSLSNDAKNLYVVFQTEAMPPATTGVGYRLRANPDGAGGAYCLQIDVYYPGANNALTAAEAWVRDVCAGGEAVPVEVLGATLTVPRSALEAFGKGATLTAPQAQAYLYIGSSPPAGFVGPMADTTKVGTDYKFVETKKKKG